MSVEIEGLEFQIEAKSDKVSEGVDKLADSFKNLKSAIRDGSGLKEQIKHIEKMNQALSGLHTEKLEKFGKAMEALNGIKNIKIPASVPKRIKEIGSAMKTISQSDIDRMERMNKALQGMPNGKIGSSVPLTSGKKTSGSVNQEQNISDVSGVDTGITHANGQLQELESNAQKGNLALRSLKFTIRQFNGITGLSYIGNQLKSIPSKIKDCVGNLRTMYQGFKKSGGILGAFGRTVKAVATSLSSKLAAGMKHVTSSMGNAFTSKVHRATGALGSFLSSLKRIALYRMIRFAMSQLTQCFKEGINNLYNYSSLMGGTFANSMNSLATNALYLKNSMGAMAAPLINALAPAIDFVVDKVAYLFNVFNQLFARLTGSKTYTAAKKVATTYGGAAKDAANTASKAAKKAVDEIKRYTLGFDELNILGDKNKNNDSGGAGSGLGGNTTPDYGSMFEELPIDSSIGKFADRLKEAFEAGDWKELGTILGEKFNEIADSINWKGFGKKVGYGINGAVKTAYYFLKTADFKKLGKNVAKFLNAGLSQIDFNFVGRLLVRGITAGLDFLIGALRGLNWKRVGKSVGDLLRGVFNEAQEWIAGIDWKGMAHSLYKNIKDCIAGIDFASVAESFFKLLGSALAAAVSFISTFVADIWKDITGYFHEYLINDDGTKKCGLDWVAGILQGIWDGIKNIGSWIKENVFDPFIDGFKSVFGIHSPSTVMMEMGGYLVEGLLNGLKNGFINVITWVGNTFERIKTTITNVWENVKTTTSTIWQSIKTTLSGTWNTLKNKVSTTWQGIKTTISTVWDNVKTKTSNIWESVKTTTGKVWDSLKTKVGKTWDNMKQTVSKAWDKVRTNTDTTWSKLNTNLSKTWDKLKRNASDVFKSVKKTITDKIGDARDAVGEGVERMKNSLNFDWHLPHIPLPHFGITGHFGLNPPSIPHFSVSWYKNGGILEGAQLFGMMGNTMLGGGEAGREAVLPLESHTEWMDILAHKVRSGISGTNSDSIADGVREGMYDATARQNELLKEQNDLLRQIASKEFSTQITTSSITNALNRKNQRDGKTIIPVGI